MKYSLLTNDDDPEECLNIFSDQPKSVLVDFLNRAQMPLSSYTVQEWEGDTLTLTLNAEEWTNIENYA